MGRKSRSKGLLNERQIVNLLKEIGLTAQRVPLSGAAGGLFAGDIVIDGQVYEAKIKATGFKQIYDWLDDNAGLFIRSDRHELLIVVRAADWADLKLRAKKAAA